jgi:hypothetical protein
MPTPLRRAALGDLFSAYDLYYDDKIWDYVAAHPAADEEAIATMLFRYRDKPKP